MWRLNSHLVEVSNNGAICWYDEDDLLHRDGDLPSMITKDGHIYYHKHGTPHRDNNKPARIYASGEVEYWFNGERSWP